jgi:hypothetical protein
MNWNAAHGLKYQTHELDCAFKFKHLPHQLECGFSPFHAKIPRFHRASAQNFNYSV